MSNAQLSSFVLPVMNVIVLVAQGQSSSCAEKDGKLQSPVEFILNTIVRNKHVPKNSNGFRYILSSTKQTHCATDWPLDFASVAKSRK